MDRGSAWFSKELVSYGIEKVDELEEISEENKAKVLSAVGWGAIGALALGPVGLLAGLFLGGRREKKVVFVVKFKDGKRALIETDQNGWKSIVAARHGLY